MLTFGFDDPTLYGAFVVNLFLDVTEEPDDELVEAIKAARPVEELLNALRSETAEVRSRASQMLWYLWMTEAGELAYAEVREGIELIERGKTGDAIDCITRLVENYPDFAEAYNKRATAHFMEGNFAESVKDCLATLKRNPHHFGAWHGLGLCYVELGLLEQAITAFRCGLRVQPFAAENARLLAYCRGQQRPKSADKPRSNR